MEETSFNHVEGFYPPEGALWYLWPVGSTRLEALLWIWHIHNSQLSITELDKASTSR